jgi:histidinol-phosphatase (PHP family)
MIDYHVHSTCSFDGASPLHQYVGTAQMCGLTELGFAEHVDLDSELEEYQFLDYPGYYKTLKELQQKASIPIRCGVEVSYQQDLEDSIQDYLAGKACDFVIGSVHEVHGITMDHTFLEQFSPLDYFEAVKKLVKSGLCDIVGHLEYFKRWGNPYSSSPFKDAICSVLQLMIEKNVVLEINTSGLRHPARDTYPSFEVIQWYRDLRGELISLGSDAHAVEHLAFQFSPVIKTLLSEGFCTVATFDKRKMKCVDLQ